MKDFKIFTWKKAKYRISCVNYKSVIQSLKQLRAELEDYIKIHPDFKTSLQPVRLKDNAPLIARRMAEAAHLTGVGPMAAVAGTMAQLAAGKALQAGANEVIIDNGGDIYLSAKKEIVIGIYPGSGILSGALAFSVVPEIMPLAVCSSSSKMGHSLSFGDCDLATVTSKNAALADAAATLAGNLVKTIADIPEVLERIVNIPGILGVLLIKDAQVGLAGDLPEVIKHKDAQLLNKIGQPWTILL